MAHAPATGIASSSPMPLQLFLEEEMNQGVATLKNLCKEYNRVHYRKRKLRAIAQSPPVTMTTTMTRAMSTTITTTVTATSVTTPAGVMSSSADPWSFTIHGTLRMPAAARKTKCRMVKPAVNAICHGGNIILEAAVLCAVADHSALNAAHKLVGIETLKTLAGSKKLC
jgi:hypothetical protein